MACLQIYWELLPHATFLQVHSNSKEVSYLSWQTVHPNLKTTCHLNLKFFLWTKLLENILLAKYLISVAVTLRYYDLLYFVIYWGWQLPDLFLFLFELLVLSIWDVHQVTEWAGVNRPFQERCVIARAHTQTCAKVFWSVINHVQIKLNYTFLLLNCLCLVKMCGSIICS